MAAPKKKARTAPASAEKAVPAKRKSAVKPLATTAPNAPAKEKKPRSAQKRSKVLKTEDELPAAQKNGVLPNAKHEIFAQEVARGTGLEQAYVKAGYKASFKNAHRLKINEDVRSRIEDIQSQAAQNVGLSIEKVLKELAKIGFSDIRKTVKWGTGIAVADDNGDARVVNGVALIGSDDIDDDTAAAISEVTQTKDGLKIKLHDKRAALVDIGRHMGMFKEKVEHTGKDGAPLVAERTVIVLPANGRE